MNPATDYELEEPDTPGPVPNALAGSVADFLKAKPGVADEAQSVPLDLSEADLRVAGQIPEAAPATKKVELPGNPLLSAKLNTDNVWKRAYKGGEVSVSKKERDLYLKAALTGEAIVFDLSLELQGGNLESVIRCRCRTLNDFETSAIYRAAQLDQIEAGGLLMMAQLNLLMQQYCVILHVLNIDGAQQHTLSFPGPVFPPVEVAADLIRTYYQAHYQKLHPARHQLLMTAVQIFERKINICAEAMANGNFLKRADTV